MGYGECDDGSPRFPFGKPSQRPLALPLRRIDRSVVRSIHERLAHQRNAELFQFQNVGRGVFMSRGAGGFDDGDHDRRGVRSDVIEPRDRGQLKTQLDEINMAFL